jgi:hypothetical protein
MSAGLLAAIISPFGSRARAAPLFNRAYRSPMRRKWMVLGPALVALGSLSGCGADSRAAGVTTKGGDDRSGAYQVVEG